MALVNVPRRFQVNILFTQPLKTVKIDIPNFFDISKQTKFLVTSIIGKTSTSASPMFLHCPTLRSQQIYYDYDNSNDLIATTVLGINVANTFSYNAKNIDIGFDYPNNLLTHSTFDFVINDHLGNLLNDLSYAIVTLEVFQTNV
jgi:hypothetical protein